MVCDLSIFRLELFAREESSTEKEDDLCGLQKGGRPRLGRTNNCPADTFVRANVKEEASGSFSSPPPKESTNDLCEPPPTCPSTYLYSYFPPRLEMTMRAMLFNLGLDN